MSHDPEVYVQSIANGMVYGVAEYAISTELLDAAVEEIQKLVAQRDRARELAAHLEEIVAMRTSVLRAFVDVKSFHELPALQEWAAAQLSEVP
jgi:fructose/tagatose bisphosphate aldolase